MTQGEADRSYVGLVYVDGIVSAPGAEPIKLSFLVDSGADYSLLPHDVWRRLGLTPKRTLRLRLADGTTIERSVSECHIELPMGDGHTPVILGEPDDVALLGVLTLEVLGFVLNPFDRSVRPMRALLLSIA